MKLFFLLIVVLVIVCSVAHSADKKIKKAEVEKHVHIGHAHGLNERVTQEHYLQHHDEHNHAHGEAHSSGGRTCGTHAVSEQKQAEVAARLQPYLEPTLRGTHAKVMAKKTIKVDVYFHVLQMADGTGAVTQQQITDQITYMNEAFAPNLMFTLKGKKILPFPHTF
ncbi:hypothetical protein EON65_50525 [archaeon]|nr:MAG: hypothetical protein EON65_50525 [archaeon]